MLAGHASLCWLSALDDEVLYNREKKIENLDNTNTLHARENSTCQSVPFPVVLITCDNPCCIAASHWLKNEGNRKIVLIGVSATRILFDATV